MFLRTAEKKREAARPKEVPEPAPEPIATSTDPALTLASESQAAEADIPPANGGTQPLNGSVVGAPTETPPDVTQDETDVCRDYFRFQKQILTVQTVQQKAPSNVEQDDPKVDKDPTGENDGDEEEDSDDDVIITTKRTEQPPQADEQQEFGENGGDGDGDEQMQDTNGYSNAAFSAGGDANQMQMMMAMQNNMGFPMMGK